MSGYLMSDFPLDEMKDKLIGLPWKHGFVNVENGFFLKQRARLFNVRSQLL